MEKFKIQNSWVKTSVFILLLLFYSSLLIYKNELPVADDLAQHIKNGENIVKGNFGVLYSNFYSYTEPEHSFTNHSGLSAVVFYFVHVLGGWNGLSIFKILIYLSSFCILFFATLKKSHFWLVSFVSFPSLLLLTERTILRPEVFSYLFLSIFIYSLFWLEENPSSNKIFWLVPLQILWVNMHLFFILGIGMVGAFLISRLLLNPRNIRKNFESDPLIKKLIILVLLLSAISVFNPHGLEGAMSPVLEALNLSNGKYGLIVSEDLSVLERMRTTPPWDDLALYLFMPAVFLLCFSFVLNFKEKPLFLFIISVSTALGGFVAIRLINFFGLIFILTFSSNFSPIFKHSLLWFKEQPIVLKRIIKTCLVFIVALLLLVVSLYGARQTFRYSKFGIGLEETSNKSADFLKQQEIKGPIFNDYDVGSYLIYHLFPNERVFLDNRYDAYSADFLREVYAESLRSEEVWQKTAEKYKFNTIFFYQYNAGPNIREFLWRRMRDPLWSLVYVDKYSIIFLKNVPENKKIIDEFAITRNNVSQKLEHLVRSADFDDQVAAADTFNLIGREDLGSQAFLSIAYKWPGKSKIWLVMGEWELSRNRYDSNLLAMMYIERAIAEGQKTAEAYSFLGFTYYALGQNEKSKQALEKAIKLNPDRMDARELLEQINNPRRE